MKFKSALLTQVSGSLGGITFAHNQGGMYMRARAIPTNPNTPRQSVIRNAMGLAQSAFKALDGETRFGWNQYGNNTILTNPLGDEKKLTGRAHFIRQYILRAQADVTQIITFPPLPGLAILSPIEITRHLTTDTVDVAFTNTDAWAANAGGFLAVYQSGPQNGGVDFYKGPFKYVGKVAGAGTPPTSPANMASLQDLESGQRYFFRVIAVDKDGRLASEQFLPVDIS